jgi:hypothetical protein
MIAGGLLFAYPNSRIFMNFKGTFLPNEFNLSSNDSGSNAPWFETE